MAICTSILWSFTSTYHGLVTGYAVPDGAIWRGAANSLSHVHSRGISLSRYTADWMKNSTQSTIILSWMPGASFLKSLTHVHYVDIYDDKYSVLFQVCLVTCTSSNRYSVHPQKSTIAQRSSKHQIKWFHQVIHTYSPAEGLQQAHINVGIVEKSSVSRLTSGIM